MKPGYSQSRSVAEQRWRGRAQLSTSSIGDPFAINPIRRAAGLVAVCSGILVVPWLISEPFGITMMLATGWLAVTGLVMGLPIVLWCGGEWIIEAIQRRIRPGIELLGLSPRVEHILSRHDVITIRQIEELSDDGLLLLSNMDQRGVREVRQAVAVWKYQRWQESGFTAIGNE
ncbi:MAG: hypothetical protein IT334_10535 [Thermomicrobiales bacterium]|nr:hypothetical protein [Thermomicrobiales bacterium]